MPTVKRTTGKRAATKGTAGKRNKAKTKAKTNRPKTAKKAVKKATKKVVKKALTAEQKKRKAAAKKAAETRKANAAKAKRSAAAKKAAATRKTKRKTTKKAARPERKRTHVDGRSREAREARRGRTYVKECAKLLLRRKFTDIEIRDKLAETFGEKYSGAKHTRHIRKYRSLLNSGGLEYAGFERPTTPVQEVGRTSGAEEAGLSRRQVRRRRRERIDKGLVMGPRARARARRLQAAGVSSPGTTGSSSPVVEQPTARRARRR